MIADEVIAEQARLIEGHAEIGRAVVGTEYPGEKNLSTEMVFANGTEGGITYPYAMAGERIQRHQFNVLWVVRVTANPTIAEAKARRNELTRLVLGVFSGDDLLGFEALGEKVTDTNPDAQPIQVTTREGDDPKTGRPIAIAEITVPIETQTLTP